MDIKNLLNRLTNEDIKENCKLLDHMCNENLDNNLCNDNLIYKSIIKENGDLYNDLEIFEDFKGKNNTILEKIDNTYTDGGRNYLKKLLENPSDNYDFLNSKKESLLNLFKILKSDNEIQRFFIKLEETEKSLFWIFKTNDVEQDNLVNILYFNNFILKYLNNSSIVLSGFNIYNIFLSPMIGILSPIIGFIIPYLILRFKLKVKFSFITYIKFLYNYYVNANFGSMFGNSYLNTLRKIWYAFTMLFYFNGIFNSFQLSKLSNNINLTICGHISNCSIFIKNGIQILNKIYNKNDYLKIFNLQFDFEVNNSIVKQLNSLNITTNEYFNNFGQKLKLYKLIKDPKHKHDIFNLINLIYLSDTINSLHSVKNLNELSISEYIDSEEPYISINGLRHPNIDSNKVVKNDIILDNHNNLIITGPNAGGKSTFIKSIAINILLSQTICFTFTDMIKLTPFHYIASQMTIIDDKGYESLFEAEMNRIIKNVEAIKECNDTNKKSIIFLDELFNSTNVIEGICGSYGICKSLADIKTNITLLTTHFTYLYKLKDTKKYKNYKMNVKIEDENIEFPYKISEGISTQYIALELLNKKLKSCREIIETSLEFKKNLIKKI
tara:strand:+ start:232 stop:2061 length:1830 start_codon:yes stop_codon:yes gene_type:complete